MLKIDETSTESGELTSVFLRVDDGVFALVDARGTFALPHGALEVVMRRYGAPFDDSASQRITRVATLEIGPGCALHHVRHLARFDVIGRDWLVYERTDHDALCVLAREAARALAHLAAVEWPK